MTGAMIILQLSVLGATYHEAPMLHDLVRQGRLPPVEQRLPQDPMVVPPYERIGVYGGTMKVISGEAQVLNESRYMLYAPRLRFAADGQTIVPNLANRWEMSKGGKVCTIHLRRGVKWSDGAPMTVDDVLFAWQDVLDAARNPQITPSAFCVDGKPMKIERVDDYTFRMVFDEPYGSLPYFLTHTVYGSCLVQPKHYLMCYHPRYTPQEKLDQMARAGVRPVVRAV